MNPSDARAYEMHRLVAEKIQRDPDSVLNLAMRNIRQRSAKGVHPHYRRWLEILERGPADVIAVLLDPGERGQELRSSSPFAGALSEDERQRSLERAHSNAQ